MKWSLDLVYYVGMVRATTLVTLYCLSTLGRQQTARPTKFRRMEDRHKLWGRAGDVLTACFVMMKTQARQLQRV
jgi:hypothetical protein